MLGCVAICLGVLSSWEAALAPIGLIAACWMLSDRRGVKRGFAYLMTGTVTACTIFSWYFWQCPQLVVDTVQTVRFRLGMGAVYSGRVIYNQGGQEYLSRHTAIRSEIVNLVGVVGVLGLLLIMGYLATQVDRWRFGTPEKWIAGFVGVCAPLVVWFAVVWNHAAVHAYESVLALAPAAFAAAGLFVTAQAYLAELKNRAWARRALLTILIPLALLAPLATQLYDSFLLVRQHEMGVPDREIRLGRLIEASTSPGSIVLSPDLSLVPVWYSRRNTSRGISDDHQVQAAIEELRAIQPVAPIYLVGQSEDRPKLTHTLTAYPSREIGEGVWLVDLQGPVR
jgi:hypothetical protein